MATDSLAEEFRAWALDPARSNDELFTVELLMEQVRGTWQAKHLCYEPFDYEKTRAHIRERAGNPLYRPRLTGQQFDQAAEVEMSIKRLSAWHQDDRPVRDLQALRFFPLLEDVNIHQAEIADLSPLLQLPKLTQLTLQEPPRRLTSGLRSLATLGGMAGLRTLCLQFAQAWPDLSPLGQLSELETFHYHGNPLALAAIGTLPGVTQAKLSAGFHHRTPMRSLAEMPRMPRLQVLELALTDDLAGIEAFPELVNVRLEGTFRSLEPLAALARATALELASEHFYDVEPLTRMPVLRELKLVREEPLSLDVLTDAPALCSVEFERCPIMLPELAGLNAALTPWSHAFLLPEPRPARPVRFFSHAPSSEETSEYYQLHREEYQRVRPEFRDDPALAAAYRRWAHREGAARLSALLGPGGRVGAGLLGHLTFRREEDALYLREIVEVLDLFQRQCRYPEPILLQFQPTRQEELEKERAGQERIAGLLDGGGERDWLDRPFDPQQEREDHEEFRRNRRAEFERRAREHRLRLQQEQGLTPDPQEYSTLPAGQENPDADPDPAPAPESELEDEEDGDFGSDDAGDAADGSGEEGDYLAVPRELFMLSLFEGVLWVTEHMRAGAEYYWGERAEDWHSCRAR